MIDKAAYRAAAMRPGGWANANLRTQFLKIIRKAGVPAWGRLFHCMRASRQTELEREHPLHVVCSWLGNTEAVAKKNYVLVTEADFAKAVEVRGTKTTRSDEKQPSRGTKTTLPPPGKPPQPNEKTPGNPGKSYVFREFAGVSRMEAGGIEPQSDSLGKTVVLTNPKQKAKQPNHRLYCETYFDTYLTEIILGWADLNIDEKLAILRMFRRQSARCKTAKIANQRID